MAIDKDKVLIIDGLNFIYRGLNSFSKSAGNTNTIVYSFFRNFRSLFEQIKPNKCFVALEGNPKFRKLLFSDYKANRIKTAGAIVCKEEIYQKAEIIFQLLLLLPITLVRALDYEGDDVINSLALNLRDEHLTIVSTDSDLIQILQNVKGEVFLYNPTNKEYLSAPDYSYLVYKCLTGDESDNIPRIVSDAKAREIASTPLLLREFLSKEEQRANFSLNRQLIELKNIPSGDLIINQGSLDLENLFIEFEKLEFKSFLTDSYREKFSTTFINHDHIK